MPVLFALFASEVECFVELGRTTGRVEEETDLVGR